jgi:hypothetical protein
LDFEKEESTYGHPQDTSTPMKVWLNQLQEQTRAAQETMVYTSNTLSRDSKSKRGRIFLMKEFAKDGVSSGLAIVNVSFG